MLLVSNIIFLIGKAGSGKDTVAKLFAKEGYKRIAFADKLKKEYYSGICVEYCADNEDRAFKEKHRQGLILYGESMRAKYGGEYWIEKAFKEYTDDDKLFGFREDCPDLIVTDVRRDSELDYITSLKLFSNAKVFFYYIDRQVEDSDELTLSTIRKSMFCVDDVIDNNGTLKQLKENVRKISREIKRESRRDSEDRVSN